MFKPYKTIIPGAEKNNYFLYDNDKKQVILSSGAIITSTTFSENEINEAQHQANDLNFSLKIETEPDKRIRLINSISPELQKYYIAGYDGNWRTLNNLCKNKIVLSIALTGINDGNTLRTLDQFENALGAITVKGIAQELLNAFRISNSQILSSFLNIITEPRMSAVVIMQAQIFFDEIFPATDPVLGNRKNP